MPGHKNWAIGEEVLAADFNPYVADQIVAVYASAAARTAGWPAPPTGAISFLTDSNQLHVFNGTVWTCITPVSLYAPGNGTTGATTYGDLTGGTIIGPAVSLLTGPKALVRFGANLSNNTLGFGAFMSFAVSGATTIAAQDGNAAIVNTVNAAGQNYSVANEILVTGLTAGINTFTAKWRTNGGQAQCTGRSITVVGVP